MGKTHWMAGALAPAACATSDSIPQPTSLESVRASYFRAIYVCQNAAQLRRYGRPEAPRPPPGADPQDGECMYRAKTDLALGMKSVRAETSLAEQDPH